MASMKILVLALVLCFVALASAYPRVYILDDGEVDAPEEVHSRVRRDDEYAGGKAYGKGYGKVGPVYTFVKTDPKANFKWGVRHRVGASYQ